MALSHRRHLRSFRESLTMASYVVCFALSHHLTWAIRDAIVDTEVMEELEAMSQALTTAPLMRAFPTRRKPLSDYLASVVSYA